MKFEQMHIEDQLQLALETLRMMFDGKCRTVAQFAAANDQTVLDVWRNVCAEVGFDECEPWEGFPEVPKRESWNSAAGGDREISDYYQKLLDQMKVWTGKDKH